MSASDRERTLVCMMERNYDPLLVYKKGSKKELSFVRMLAL